MAQEHHEELIKGISEQLAPILRKSKQAVYISLDDTLKVCNEKFAKLLGYRSAKDWAAIHMPLSDIDEASRDGVVAAHENATDKFIASSLDIALRNVKTNKLIRARMIIVPMVYRGHVFAIHFLSEL
jgi:hypothetical protein